MSLNFVNVNAREISGDVLIKQVDIIYQENKRLEDIVARASRNDSQDWGWDDEDDEDITSPTNTSTGINN